MSYDLRLARRAQSYLSRLDDPMRRRVAARLDEIADDPFGPQTKPLTGGSGTRSARVGGYRIIFSVDVPTRTVDIEAIGPRGQIYRGPPC